MQVELGTLPIYFCALYSIERDNGGWGTKARSNILGTYRRVSYFRSVS